MRTTIRDVAMAAGCSITAVSLVLNGKTRNISAQTEARILDAAKQLNYHPNKLASHLVTKKSNIIGLILPDNCNLFFGAESGGTRSGSGRLSGHLREFQQQHQQGLRVYQHVYRLLCGRDTDYQVRQPQAGGK
mgnify:CR=1 FL=1